MHKQHPQIAYRKYAVLIGTIFENCDKNESERGKGDCGMLKIAVVEDQQEVRDELCRFIRQYAAENSLQVEVLPIEDGAVIAEHYEPG
jgi:hypothetical protein